MRTGAVGTGILALALLLGWVCLQAQTGEELTMPRKPDTRAAGAIQRVLAGRFKWTITPPLVSPARRPSDPCHAVKDPTIVRHGGRWHLFCSIRSRKRSHQIEYLSFADWRQANRARRHVLTISAGYFCAPQVFYFRPHRRWYLVYQVVEPSRKPALQPAFSTTADVADPGSWTKPTLLFAQHPANVKKMWIDFWVICDAAKAYLFYTTLDGRMWRAETKLADFPHGWGRPKLALRGDIFEASHTYTLKGLGKYLTIVEAQAGARRYYKAYLADALDGKWTPLAATPKKPFASPLNAVHAGQHWTDYFSHGELLRAGRDETIPVDPAKLVMLFQGVSDAAARGKKYGQIPWRLGLLRAAGQE